MRMKERTEKFLVVLIPLLLMGIYSYSQDSYPKKIVFDRDTCIAISIDQLKSINLKLQKKDFLTNLLQEYIKKTEKDSAFISQLHLQIQSRDLHIEKINEGLHKSNQLFTDQKQINKELEKQLQRRKNLNKYLLGGITILSTLTLLQL